MEITTYVDQGWNLTIGEIMRRAIILILLLFALVCGPSLMKPRLPPAPPIGSHTANSPFATREGTSIVLQPSGLRFSVPQKWVDWYKRRGNNFHLTAEQLDRVGNGAGEWDDEYARVCNAIFPFDRCAAHVGEEGWGKEGVSYADLQVRVYDLESPLEDVEEHMGQRSPTEIGRLINGSIQVKKGDNDGWRQTILSYGRFYYDYADTARVDIRIKSFGKKTIAFVFMYTGYDEQQKVITDILHSVRDKD
jgi:hypothetical protein